MTSPSFNASSGSPHSPSPSPSASGCSPSASTSSATSCGNERSASEISAIAAFVAAFHAHEQQLAGVFASGNRLNAAASVAQQALTAKLGYLGGHQVITALAASQSHVSQAMTTTAEGHRKLSRIGAAIGYRFDGSDYGDSQKDPKSVMSILTSLVAGGTTVDTAN